MCLYPGSKNPHHFPKGLLNLFANAHENVFAEFVSDLRSYACSAGLSSGNKQYIFKNHK